MKRKRPGFDITFFRDAHGLFACPPARMHACACTQAVVVVVVHHQPGGLAAGT